MYLVDVDSYKWPDINGLARRDRMETKKGDKLSDTNDLTIGLRLKYLRENHGFR